MESIHNNEQRGEDPRDNKSSKLIDTIRLQAQNSSDFTTHPDLELLHPRQVTKSPTHKELGQNERDPEQKVFMKKAALSKYASPSARGTKQMMN